MLKKEVKKGVPLKLDMATQAMTYWKKILTGRLDVVVSNEVVGYDIIMKNEWGDKIKAVEKPLYSKDYFMSFTKMPPARNLIPKINEIIADLKRNGEIQRILKSI
jgi:ABC-type amino acid transport substrate-binding protein